MDKTTDLDNYFKTLNETQLAYLEMLDKKNYGKDKDIRAVERFNPFRKYGFVKENFVYLDEEGYEKFRIANNRYMNSSEMTLTTMGCVTAGYIVYKLFTTPKTTSMVKHGFIGATFGLITGMMHFGYEYKVLHDAINPIFISIIQQRIKSRGQSK